MLNKIRQLIDLNQSHEAFFKGVSMYYPPGSADYRLIENAYIETRKTCRDQKRDDGSDYFSHPRAVAVIVMHYLRERDPEVIAAAITHDLPEDFRKIWTYSHMQISFTPRVAELNWWTTKPPVEDFGGDKEARNRHYHSTLMRAPREPILVKIPDRLHNTITLKSTTGEKQVRKVRETQDFYQPLAEKHHLLIHELEAALDEIMVDW